MKSFSSALTVGLLAIFLLVFGLSASAQAPAWQLARAVAVATSGFTQLDVSATAVDAAGNVYIAGTFTNTVVLGGTTLTSLGLNDVFVAKFNPVSNQFIWAQRAGGTNDEYATALVVSGTSVYVAGYFYTTAVFGATTLSGAGLGDVFVAKLTDAGSTGSFVWAQRAGGTELDQATALAISGPNVYVAGHFASPTASFGTTPLTPTSMGSTDIFVAKLIDAGSTGSFAWAQRAGGSDYDYAYSLAVSGNNVYVTGSFRSPTAAFGATTLTLTSAGEHDVFVAKLIDSGSTGSFVWAQQAGGTGEDVAFKLAVSGTSVYVAGSFNSPTAGFGPATLTNAGADDIFVAKLTDAGPTGSFVWAQRAGGAGIDVAQALAVSGTSVYVAGYFKSPTAGFGPVILTNTGNANLFVAKFIDIGSISSFSWAQQAGGAGIETVQGMAVSGTSVYVAGPSRSPMANFGTITLANPYGYSFGFLASLADPTLTATAAGHALPPAQLFPNPAQRTATLRLPAGTVPAPLVLTDALGRTVRCYPAPAGSEAALDLQGVPAGLYLLRGAGPVQRLVVE